MPPARALLYLATLAAVIGMVRAAAGAPPPAPIALLAGALYLGLILAGVFVLRLRLFVDAIVRGPRGARGVVLTFDDGPDPEWTPKVLELLDARGAKATFFVIARKAEEHPALIREILARGHTVGVHSYDHDRLLSLRSGKRVREDLARAANVLEAITGARPVLFRPPVGHTNPVIARAAESLGLVCVGWSVSGRDGVKAHPSRVAARVRAGLRDGAIVLLHDAAERGDREPAAPRALPEILEAIAEARLEVVALSTFL